MCGRSSRGNASEATGKFSPRARAEIEATSNTAEPLPFAPRGRNSGHVEAGSGPDPTAVRLPGGKLDDGFGAARARHPPGPNVGRHLQHLTVAGEKDRVDRKTHEKHVNRPSGPKQQPLPRLQRPPPEQPPHPRQSIVGDATTLADN